MRFLCVLAVVTMCGAVARADIYSYTDKDGIIHFTNITPKGAAKKQWTRVAKTGPGKAAAARGSCERCDQVPAQDSSAERFTRYDAFIAEAAQLYSIPEPLIRAVIYVESNYDPRVVSSVGARGLMQLMPDAAKDMKVPHVHDPRENILGGTRLLRLLANRFDGDLVLTIAAYHAGAGSVTKYGNTIPPYETTQLYVRMVLKAYYQYKKTAKAD